MRANASKTGMQRRYALRGTARVDREILDPGLRSRAAQRAIEQCDALNRQELAGVVFGRDRQGAGFDDDLIAMVGTRKLGGDIVQGFRRG